MYVDSKRESLCCVGRSVAAGLGLDRTWGVSVCAQQQAAFCQLSPPIYLAKQAASGGDLWWLRPAATLYRYGSVKRKLRRRLVQVYYRRLACWGDRARVERREGTQRYRSALRRVSLESCRAFRTGTLYEAPHGSPRQLSVCPPGCHQVFFVFFSKSESREQRLPLTCRWVAELIDVLDVLLWAGLD